MNEFTQQLNRNSGSTTNDNLTIRRIHDIATRVKKALGTSEVHQNQSAEQSSHSQRLMFSPIQDRSLSTTPLTLTEDVQSVMLDYQSILSGSDSLFALEKQIVQKENLQDKKTESSKSLSCMD